MSFRPLPRRTFRSPVNPGSAHLALDLFGPVVAAPRIAERPLLAPAAPLLVAPVEVPVEMPAAAPAVSDDPRPAGGAFRVEVLVPGADGWAFPVRESVVAVAPSARAARLEAADAEARPVAVFALVGSDELLVWGSAADLVAA